MRVLVTGGTGVVGRSTVTALLQRGHVVRLLSRHAERDARRWTQGVHPVMGSVTNPASLRGAADDCEAVLHLAGIVEEHGQETFERVNVDGTRHVIAEAERAGVGKFIYVSSLGADRGTSAYHESKRKAEALVRAYRGGWMIVRLANVYGPGDEQISLLLRLVRTLPVVPVIGSGQQEFQPIWHDDAAEVLSRAVERTDLLRRELDVAGSEVTSQNDLVQRLARITGRDVPQVPIPTALAKLGMRAAAATGVALPFDENQLRMLLDGNVILPGRENALVMQFRITPTPLQRGLELLADAQEEQLPSRGVGPLRRKRYRVDLQGTGLTPEHLMQRVRERFAEVMASFIDVGAEPGADPELELGATLTLALPLRGHIQVRVMELEPRLATLLTLRGHPLAGAVRLLAEARGPAVRFEIQVFERPADVADLVFMRTIGERFEDQAWREMATNVARVAGGSAPAGVEVETDSLDDDQAERIEQWLADLVTRQQREAAGV